MFIDKHTIKIYKRFQQFKKRNNKKNKLKKKSKSTKISHNNKLKNTNRITYTIIDHEFLIKIKPVFHFIINMMTIVHSNFILVI